MQVKNLSPNDQNPRKIQDHRLKMLKKAMARFGDLSGIVYNRKTERLVGGHQRTKIFDAKSPVTILNKHSRPTKTGTVAEGYVLLDNERFSYREVYWDEKTEKAANIAANKAAGEWEQDQLNSWLKGLNELEFDLELTMFDSVELPDFGSIEVSAHTRKSKSDKEDERPDEEDNSNGTPPIASVGDIFLLGKHKLKIGETDFKTADKLVKYWERQTGEKAQHYPLSGESKLKKKT